MLDHILCYTSAAQVPSGPLGLASWDDESGRTWMPVACIITEGTTDPATGEIVAPPVFAPGIWMVVRARSRQADLEADPHCLIITDSERAAAGEPFVLLCRLEPDTLLGRISPVFAGDAYPFPQGTAAGLLPLTVIDSEAGP